MDSKQPPKRMLEQLRLLVQVFLPQALKVSFGGGTVMGLGVAGLAVLGLTGFFIFFFFHEWGLTNSEDMTIVWRL
jgi:Na+/H+-translocating membrane pyrophosphatase